MARIVQRSLAAVNIPVSHDDPRFRDTLDRASGYHTTSLLCVPIVVNGEATGALQVFNKLDGPEFTAEDEATVQFVAQALAITMALRSAEVQVEERKSIATQLEVTSFLLKAATAILSDVNLITIMAQVVEIGKKFGSCERCILYLVDQANDEVVTRALIDGVETEERTPIGSGIVAGVVETGEVVNIVDALSDERFSVARDAIHFSREEGEVEPSAALLARTKSLLCLPIFSDSGAVIAIINLVNKSLKDLDHPDNYLGIDPAGFSEEDQGRIRVRAHIP